MYKEVVFSLVWDSIPKTWDWMDGVSMWNPLASSADSMNGGSSLTYVVPLILFQELPLHSSLDRLSFSRLLLTICSICAIICCCFHCSWCSHWNTENFPFSISCCSIALPRWSLLARLQFTLTSKSSYLVIFSKAIAIGLTFCDSTKWRVLSYSFNISTVCGYWPKALKQ